MIRKDVRGRPTPSIPPSIASVKRQIQIAIDSGLLAVPDFHYAKALTADNSPDARQELERCLSIDVPAEITQELETAVIKDIEQLDRRSHLYDHEGKQIVVLELQPETADGQGWVFPLDWTQFGSTATKAALALSRPSNSSSKSCKVVRKCSSPFSQSARVGIRFDRNPDSVWVSSSNESDLPGVAG